MLVLESCRRGPVTNTVVMSYAAPGYTPHSRHLVQATAVGIHDPDLNAVRHHLADLYGVPTGHWELIGHYPIAEALPAAVPPFQVRSRQDFDGVLVAGDHRDTPSIRGAGQRQAGGRHRPAPFAVVGPRATALLPGRFPNPHSFIRPLTALSGAGGWCAGGGDGGDAVVVHGDGVVAVVEVVVAP